MVFRKVANDIMNIEPSIIARIITSRFEGVTVIPTPLYENIRVNTAVSKSSNIIDAIKSPEYNEVKYVIVFSLLYLIKMVGYQSDKKEQLLSQ